MEIEVANKFIDKHAEFNIDNVVDVNAVPIPQHGGYHQMCYTRFTGLQRVRRVIKSMQKLAAKGRFIKVCILFLAPGEGKKFDIFFLYKS